MPNITPISLKLKNRIREHGAIVAITPHADGVSFLLQHVDGWLGWRILWKDFEFEDDPMFNEHD